ncbi:ubiquitin-specific protease 9 [Actinidia rufa]|uniref:Ubiquitin-specific protease 9 n=1 Tax=Actinidia rufa TaxID=165716 RepID=A0A7J0DX90_9ERIC|nr:ubiquitin-specific protease 9 [Actinidia rufa]
MTILDSGYMTENGGVGIPFTPEEEKRIVLELTNKAEANLEEGNLYYVVSNRAIYLTLVGILEVPVMFFKYSGGALGPFGDLFSGKVVRKLAEKYTGQDIDTYLFNKHSTDSQSLVLSKPIDRPGSIDNSDIVVTGIDTKGDDLELHRTLEEGRDYVLVPQQVWEKLFDWYKGGPALPRKLISQGDVNKQFNVEVFPLCLKIIDSRDNSQSVIKLSKKASLHELYERVCVLRGTEPEKARIWDYFNKQKHEILEDSNKTLEKSELQMGQDILLEVQVDGFWPSRFGMDSTGNELALIPIEPSRSSLTIAGGPTLSNGHSTSYGSSFYRGSTLTSGFADMEDGYDTSRTATKADRGDYTDEINDQNPLGLHGELALAFGELLRKLWSSGRTPIAPRAFKVKLARFAPQFSGYNQHDSQELLAFLLDGLHEDLNRVKQKPYIETKDSDGRPDEEVADECWRYHKARNDSIIVDVCQGQYKSTLVCPVCSKISITDGSGLPMPYTVTVLKHGCWKDLNLGLATACCLRSDESLLLAEVYEHRIYRYLDSPLEPLSSIKDDDHIVAYRFPKRWAELTRLEICHRFLEKCLSDNLNCSERKLFLTPLVTYLGNPQTGADIDLAVIRVLSPLRRKTYFSLTNVNNDGKENGSASEAFDESRNSFTTHCGSGNLLMGNAELEETSCRELTFQLCITDDRGLNCRPILKDSLIKPGQVVKVILDWTNKDYESYDASYLKDLPEEEPLGPDDMWYCPRCKEHRQATKKLDLWRLPDILVFHLKRFSYSRYLKNKLDTFVNFPIHDLDLSKYVKFKDALGQPYVYELYAISNHYGGLGEGTTLLMPSWYHFDDSHVSPVSEAEITTSAAYVLFYQRVKAEPNIGLGEPSLGK